MNTDWKLYKNVQIHGVESHRDIDKETAIERNIIQLEIQRYSFKDKDSHRYRNRQTDREIELTERNTEIDKTGIKR